MDADYYLETIQTVFQDFKLVNGTWDVKGVDGKVERVRPQDIKGTALMTVEGELDDISGSGQTRAAQDLCSGVPESERLHLEVPGAGHYGIFSGRRWRDVVYPQLVKFIQSHAPKAKAKATVLAEVTEAKAVVAPKAVTAVAAKPAATVEPKVTAAAAKPALVVVAKPTPVTAEKPAKPVQAVAKPAVKAASKASAKAPVKAAAKTPTKAPNKLTAKAVPSTSVKTTWVDPKKKA